METADSAKAPAGPSRRRDALRARRGASAGLRQLPAEPLLRGSAPLELLTPQALEQIHATSMRVLEELGIELLSAPARACLRRAGADVDEASALVRLDRNLVAELVGQAPAQFTLTPRSPGTPLTLGGGHLAFGLVAGPPNVHDRLRGRRAGNLDDYRDFIRLAQHFNIIHLIGNQVCAPQELPANSRHLDTYLTNLLYATKPFHCSAIGAGRASDAIQMAALARGITVEALAHSPSVMSIININSPRRFDEAMADGLMALAAAGQPVVVTPFTLMGAMAPVTLAGALAQQNAEALFGIALAQAVRPGTPVMYGAFTSNVDLRTGAPAFGTPENAQANVISGQLARRYGLPYRSSNASASNAADAQGAYEMQMSLWGAVLGGAHLVYHGAGWQEGGLTASYEKFILDVEMLQMMSRFLAPVAVDEAACAFEAIAAVAPGGHHFGTAHTLARYEGAFYEPLLSDWQNHGAWDAAGANDATARATSLWQQALAEAQSPPIDPARREALEAYCARRRLEIGDGEP